MKDHEKLFSFLIISSTWVQICVQQGNTSVMHVFRQMIKLGQGHTNNMKNSQTLFD